MCPIHSSEAVAVERYDPLDLRDLRALKPTASAWIKSDLLPSKTTEGSRYRTYPWQRRPSICGGANAPDI